MQTRFIVNILKALQYTSLSRIFFVHLLHTTVQNHISACSKIQYIVVPCIVIFSRLVFSVLNIIRYLHFHTTRERKLLNKITSLRTMSSANFQKYTASVRFQINMFKFTHIKSNFVLFCRKSLYFQSKLMTAVAALVVLH